MLTFNSLIRNAYDQCLVIALVFVLILWVLYHILVFRPSCETFYRLHLDDAQVVLVVSGRNRSRKKEVSTRECVF